jgi:uncharacterized membrane protein YpjA
MTNALFLDDFGILCFRRKKDWRRHFKGCVWIYHLTLAVDAFILFRFFLFVLPGLRLRGLWIFICDDGKRVRSFHLKEFGNYGITLQSVCMALFS